jgi:hypothetical protein
VYFVIAYAEGPSNAIGLGDCDYLSSRLQQLPGIDNETFFRAIAVSAEGTVGAVTAVVRKSRTQQIGALY